MATAVMDISNGTAAAESFGLAAGGDLDGLTGLLPSPEYRNLLADECDDVSYDGAKISPEVRPLIRFSGPLSQRRFRILQQWEGVVTELDDNDGVFWAELIDLTCPDSEMEVVDIPLEEIPLEDRSLLLPGCVFYWSIGYETKPGGQITRASEMRVRRSPTWTKFKLQAIQERAKELMNHFEPNGNSTES